MFEFCIWSWFCDIMSFLNWMSLCLFVVVVVVVLLCRYCFLRALIFLILFFITCVCLCFIVS